jgi:DNA polymerase III subunit epsilon
MHREIVLDTETTGTDPLRGDRVVEIGCVELINHCTTGKSFHAYLNPQRPMSEGAFRVHGLSDAFLADKPVFASVADEFLAFIEGAHLVIHNAPFDVGFLNMELAKVERAALVSDLVIDTLPMARRKHPGASNSLDALCQRYNIDTAGRVRHGALLDAELLAEVYVELIGGRQTRLGLDSMAQAGDSGLPNLAGMSRRPLPKRARSLAARLTAEQQAAHAAFVSGMGDKAIWAKFAIDAPANDPFATDKPVQT